MNKRFFSALLTLALLALTAPSGAADLNIGVVNVKRLLAEAPQARSSLQALEDEFAPRLRGLKDQETEFKSELEKLQRDGAVMSDQERREAERTLRDKQRDLVRRQEEINEDLTLRRSEILGQLQKSLMEEVQSFARTQRYDMIVSGEAILFASDAVDVTAQILSALDSRFKGGD
ncbi:MAG: OmpH family outer membrane protein [Pseudomonadota bacterium]